MLKLTLTVLCISVILATSSAVSTKAKRSDSQRHQEPIGNCPDHYYWNGQYCDVWTAAGLRCAEGYFWQRQINTCILSQVHNPDGVLATGFVQQKGIFAAQSNFGVTLHTCQAGYYWNGLVCSKWTNPIVCIKNYFWYSEGNCCVQGDQDDFFEEEDQDNLLQFGPNQTPFYKSYPRAQNPYIGIKQIIADPNTAEETLITIDSTRTAPAPTTNLRSVSFSSNTEPKQSSSGKQSGTHGHSHHSHHSKQNHHHHHN